MNGKCLAVKMKYSVLMDFKDKKRGIGLAYALNGVRQAFRTERNFRIHLAAGLLAVGLAVFLKLSSYEWLFLSFSIAFVLQAELLNTAIEKMIDYIKPEYHAAAKAIKDIAAAAVLITAAAAISTGIVIFLPKLLRLFQ